VTSLKNKDAISVAVAADLLGVSEVTIRNKVKNGCDWGTYISRTNDDGEELQPHYLISRSALMSTYWQLFQPVKHTDDVIEFAQRVLETKQKLLDEVESLSELVPSSVTNA
jgi:biotin operon repressor